MGNIGLKEILVVVLIIVILFGGKRIPELARGLGRGVKEFKDGMHEGSSGDENKHNDSGEKK